MQNTAPKTESNDNLTIDNHSSNNNSIFEENQINTLFDNESVKSNSLANNIDEQEKEKAQQANLSNNNNSNEKFTSFQSEEKSYLLTPVYIECKVCKRFFSIKFYNYNYISIKCRCGLIKNISPHTFISKYCSSNSNYFNNGKKIKKYTKYCVECKRDLYDENLKDKAVPYNENGKINEHETHHVCDLFNNKKEIKQINQKLEDITNNSTYNQIYIKNILKSLIKDYKNYPNYNAYKTITNAAEFLNKSILPASNEPLKLTVLKNIFSFNSLKQSLNDTNSFYKIEIDGRETKEIFENLDIFLNKVFNELVKLEIKNIKGLKDIKALTTCFFPNLIKLFLSGENLNNTCIDILKSMKKIIPNIKFISLYNNKITSPEIFEVINEFQTLEKFYIGCNELDLNKLPNKNKKFIFPPNFIELGITFNFTKETNYFIVNNFNLENLKILYVSGNGFTSLKMFEKVHFKQLEQFWVKGDKERGRIENIEEINYLNEKGSIKVIVLKQNSIKNLEKSVDIISSFPKLEELDIRDNEIPRNEIQTVLNKIKEKRFENLKIKG